MLAGAVAELCLQVFLQSYVYRWCCSAVCSGGAAAGPAAWEGGPAGAGGADRDLLPPDQPDRRPGRPHLRRVSDDDQPPLPTLSMTEGAEVRGNMVHRNGILDVPIWRTGMEY
jgi:hypothetical protein